MADATINDLLGEVERLKDEVRADAAVIAAGWQGWIERESFAPSAANFAAYLALRRRDLRPLQRRLTAQGLSSLGRAEARVLETLQAVHAALSVLAGRTPAPPKTPLDFFAGEARLADHAEALLGPSDPRRPTRFLVTVPSEAADDPGFMLRLAKLGVEAVRINCAHDDAESWSRMIDAVDAAAVRTGRRMKVLMDLAGPKIRTGEIRAPRGGKRIRAGDRFAITGPGLLWAPGSKLRAVECTLPEALIAAQAGEPIFFDDGKLETVVVSTEGWGVTVEARSVSDEEGYKLKSEKGINFPMTDFAVEALTEKDVDDLVFVAHRADVVGFSFVQGPEDVVQLQAALARERPQDWQALGLILKIETVRAVRNLPDMLVRAAGRQPTGLMIARGDLAVEIGFTRLAEMQEELLWIGEACQTPVIWATQVLESYVKTGAPSRGEMTDAAMAARAECVMLNKGPYLFEALAELDLLLARMGEHVHKKTPQLRRLKTW